MSWQTIKNAHALDVTSVLNWLQTSENGLTVGEALSRLRQVGPNSLPESQPASALLIFLRQFKSPLIYILLAAAVLSLAIKEWLDAGFIFGVLTLNAVVGAVQEYSAEQSAQALRSVLTHSARVRRGGEVQTIEFSGLVPGDIVLMESGDKVPADMRLLEATSLNVDESLLTGESLPQSKDANALVAEDCVIADQDNMLFAGTILLRGRAIAIVVTTAMATKLGAIAEAVTRGERERPPLIQRMERMTRRIGLGFMLLTSLLVLVALAQQQEFISVLLVAVALAVAAIPEGLPVAITVALSVGMRRMAKRNVIVRRLVAAETLGSCTYIASDKTGTLTVNEMTVKQICLPGNLMLEVTGEGMSADGKVHLPPDAEPGTAEMVLSLSRTAALCNEASLYQEAGGQRASGDPVDIAMLVLARKSGFVPEELVKRYELLASIPFEPEHRYAATLHQLDGLRQLSVKGALEQVLDMCSDMQVNDRVIPMDRNAIESMADKLAVEGYRVLALAVREQKVDELKESQLVGLHFLGLVGMIDPPRPEAKDAIEQCQQAGIRVAMVTGDHPVTAVAIARQLGLVDDNANVLTGAQLHQLQHQNTTAYEDAVARAEIFARVEPTDKLDIVKALSRHGHYVAVTGDGANDAPALRSAHVGVAMGKKGDRCRARVCRACAGR